MTDWTTIPRYKHYLGLRSEADKRVDIIISLSDSGNNELSLSITKSHHQLVAKRACLILALRLPRLAAC